MKVQGWEKILSEHITEHIEKPFKWGECDCVCFVSDYSNKVTGKQLNVSVAGKYNSKESAYLYKEMTETPDFTMDGFFSRVPINFAQRGDIVLKYRGDGFTFGIVVGNKVAFKTEDGLIMEDIKEMDVAWRVE